MCFRIVSFLTYVYYNTKLIYCQWYPRGDSNSYCTVFETVASYQLRYVGINLLAGPAGIEPTPSGSKPEMISISPRTENRFLRTSIALVLSRIREFNYLLVYWCVTHRPNALEL